MKNRIEEKKEINTPLKSNGVFEVEKENTKKGIENTLKLEKIIISEEEIKKILKDKKVVQRILLLRHYPYNEENEENRKIIKEYNELIDRKFKGKEVDNYRLNMLSRKVDTLTYKKFEDIPDEKIKQVIRNTLINKEKSMFIFSKIGKERVIITGEDLVKNFLLNNIGEIDLTGSTPSDNLGDVFINMSSQLLREYNRIRNEGKYKKYEEIIIIGNRTYSYGMNLISGDGDSSIKNSENNFEKDGYIFHEYNESGKILRNTGNIIVTPENYLDLNNIFNIEHNSIIDFQNKLNVYLIKNPELIKRYVKSEIEELRKYCLLKLIERKELETLNEIFREEKFRKEIRLEDYKNIELIIFNIIRYFVEVYPKIEDTRKKSLDKRIINGEDIEPHFNFNNEEYNLDILKLINGGKPIKYIEGKAGAGKSYLLVNIAEQLNKLNIENVKTIKKNKPFYPLYINLSGNGIYEVRNLVDKVNNLVGIDNFEIVFLIDSIDESNIKIEKIGNLDEILLYLSKLGKVIITSRSGYNYDYNDLIKDEKEQFELLKQFKEIIEIKDLDFESLKDYVNKYFLNYEHKVNITHQILKKLNGAGNNPLLLCMICEIVKEGKIKDREIEKLSIIDIYSNIVELRLVDYNNEKLLQIGNKKFYETVLSGLQDIGYRQLINLEKIIDIGKYIPSPNDEISNLINLLFRKNDYGKEYDFVHQSFKEYFAAKYIFEEMKNNKEFDYEDFFYKKIQNIDLNFLEILVDFLKTDEKIKEGVLLFIDKNDKYFFPQIEYKILFLLGILDDERKNKYLKKLDYNGDFIYVLGKIGGSNNLTLIKNQINNGDYSIVEQVILELGKIGGKENIELIKERINDKNLYVRAQVIEELGKIGGKENIELIKEMISDGYNNIRIQVIEELGKIGGKENIELIKGMINDEDGYVRAKVIEELGKIGGEENIELIKEMINDEDGYVRAKVIEELGKIGGEENIKLIKEMINDKNSSVRLQVISIIRKIGGEENIKLIKEMINDKSSSVRLQVISTIRRIGGEENIKLIRKKINDKDGQVRAQVILELGRIGGEENIKLIRKKINDESHYVVENVINVLLNTGLDYNLDLIRQLINISDIKGKIYLIKKLGQIGLYSGFQLIKEQINDKHNYVRTQVIEELGKIGGKDNIDFIKNNINDDDKSVRNQVIDELWRAGGKENLEFIENHIHLLKK